MHEASMVIFRPVDIEGVQQRSNILPAWMPLGSSFYPVVDLELVIELLPHGGRLDENLESDIASGAIRQTRECE